MEVIEILILKKSLFLVFLLKGFGLFPTSLRKEANSHDRCLFFIKRHVKQQDETAPPLQCQKFEIHKMWRLSRRGVSLVLTLLK